MTANDIKSRISELCSHFLFEYDGKSCGIDPISAQEFDMWCGEDAETVDSIDKVMSTKLFSGKSLNEIAEDIEIDAM